MVHHEPIGNTMSPELLSSFMLMSIEKDILEKISSNKIIYLITAESKLLTEKLIILNKYFYSLYAL